jgi:hypothetical protein
LKEFALFGAQAQFLAGVNAHWALGMSEAYRRVFRSHLERHSLHSLNFEKLAKQKLTGNQNRNKIVGKTEATELNSSPIGAKNEMPFFN